MRRATTGLTEFSTASWEKRMLRRLLKFRKDHPLVMQVLGTGLFIAGAGVGAATMPALMAAFGLKLAVVNGTAAFSTAAVAASTAAVEGATAAGVVAAGAKVLLSTVALDLGGKLLAGPPSPQRFAGLFGKKRRSSSSDDSSRIGAMADVPLLPHRR